MKILDDLAANVMRAGYQVGWLGPVATKSVSQVEENIGVRLPPSFREFLSEYGGGGVFGAEISGIDQSDPLGNAEGTVLGDTNACQTRHGLPKGLVVIYYHDDEVCWCLDAREGGNEPEYPVVSYNVFAGKIDHIIAASFEEFLRRYLEPYCKSKGP